MAAELQRLVDIPHWLQTGEGDGTYEELVAAATGDEPAWSSKIGGDDPFFILYTGGTTGESKGALHSHYSASMGMLNQTVAERIVPSDVYMLTGQMFHIPVVLSMNYMKHGCPLVLVNFEAKQALRDHRGRARIGVPRHHHDAQLDDVGAGLRRLRPVEPAQHPVRRRPDALAHRAGRARLVPVHV